MSHPRYCKEDGCRGVYQARGYCGYHYQIRRRAGEWETGRTTVYAKEPGGRLCLTCGRPLVEHGLVEFCELVERRVGMV